ncbi:hypothetical protein, partial [Nonomuraea sp. KM90]|uniref:hypothetical protein n=1 Tax=Nonomuraea sp. KM90 TaxID=3457428 RepID=UPI003FCD82E3
MVDHDRLWLLSGLDAWQTGDIDCDPHTAVQRVLAHHGVDDLVRLVHSTSWRSVEGAVMLTYIATLDHHGAIVPGTWRASLAITDAWAAAAGRPLPHPPTAAPAPRSVDVLLHALRHLSFLAVTDASARTALNERWTSLLEPLAATRAGLYQSTGQPE